MSDLPAEVYQDLKDQLPALVEAIKTGAEYGNDLAHRFILYDIYSNIGIYLIGLIFLFFNWLAANRMMKKAVESGEDVFDFMSFMLWAIFFLLALVMVICTPILIDLVIKDIYIPEIRIVEILSDLLQAQ